MQKGVEYSVRNSAEKKEQILPKLKEASEFYQTDFSQKEGKRRCRQLNKEVSACIDRLDVVKDSAAYAFGSSLNGAIDRYFQVKKKNPKEEKRFARQSARRERLIARGRDVSWKVVPKNVYDMDELSGNIQNIFTRLDERFSEDIRKENETDPAVRCQSIVDYLKTKASQMVAHVSKSMARERALQLMEEVGINNPRERFSQYPFEFSGGMRQRIVIAIALAADPDILICDEPTTALDVTIQAQILELINKLKKERNLSIIFITHDLGVVANMADDIAVMYAGKIVEYGTAEEVFYSPAHPYTWALLASMPDLDTKEKLEAIPGTPPNMIYPPKGDAFADRNRYAMKIDFEQQPPEFAVSETHWAATWLLHPDAPKVDPPRAVTERIEKMKARLEEKEHAKSE
ncbi:MAG: ABC transporter ATP-binding protein [Clostridiales bacterium]|nr:ABC transporter ATP-binding protein [Clostridiales bacterium]